jgi:hypothetical protein
MGQKWTFSGLSAIAMWEVMQRMKDFTLAWETFQPIVKRGQTYV